MVEEAQKLLGPVTVKPRKNDWLADDIMHQVESKYKKRHAKQRALNECFFYVNLLVPRINHGRRNDLGRKGYLHFRLTFVAGQDRDVF